MPLAPPPAARRGAAGSPSPPPAVDSGDGDTHARPVARCYCSVMSEFSLDLTEDQLQVQKWVHEFAENVVRPAAAEWDEREETPWPIIQEAAQAGLYSLDFMANA